MKKCLLSVSLWLITYLAFCQSATFQHVEPAFWWTGMKNPAVQLLIHAKDISCSTVSLTYPGVTVQDVQQTDNPNYLFVTLNVSPEAKAGKLPLVFTSGKKKITYDYALKDKSTATNRIQGFSPADVMYLLMPDRFANGNPKNDHVAGMYQGLERDKPFGRHGGDLKGISDHLDFIKNLGVTALWLNPVQENNQERESYHGYAITDFYKIDRRFGSNEDYVKLVDDCHAADMKVIMDLVHNHSGKGHWWINDLPAKDWIHQWEGKKWPAFRSNFRAPAISDPYASQYDRQYMADGWFDDHMPDLNQQNKLLATYLIQNTLWWIEYAGIDGIRMDTYPYPDKQFMADWTKAVMEEYPKFNIAGEVWVPTAATTAYWLAQNPNRDQYQSYLPSSTDFPFCFSVAAALNEEGGWETGLSKLYYMLSQDFVYANPAGNVTFMDNHDLNRFFFDVKKDLPKFKMGLAFLLTTRGVPQLYYGTEILMDGNAGSHPDVRKDFPGGWPGDPVNAFTQDGRTAAQNEAHDYIRKLCNWRKTKPVIHAGKLMQFIPEDNVYVYFRYDENETVMVVMNGNTTEKTVSTTRFAERMQGFTKAKEILSDKTISDLGKLTIPEKTTLVLELE